MWQWQFGRMFVRSMSSSTRLQVFQNATQIVDPQRIRNVGIIAHIDAGTDKDIFRLSMSMDFFSSRKNNDGRANVISCGIYSFNGQCR